MKRECDKCVYHSSGNCSVWECKGTVTIEDIKRQTINEICKEDCPIDSVPTKLYADGFNDGRKSLADEYINSFIELNKLMCEYFEKWDTRKELTELEKLGLHIVTIGMQDLGAFIDKNQNEIDEVKTDATQI